MRKVKKRRLKKWVKIVLLLIIITMIYITVPMILNKPQDNINDQTIVTDLNINGDDEESINLKKQNSNNIYTYTNNINEKLSSNKINVLDTKECKNFESYDFEIILTSCETPMKKIKNKSNNDLIIIPSYNTNILPFNTIFVIKDNIITISAINSSYYPENNEFDDKTKELYNSFLTYLPTEQYSDIKNINEFDYKTSIINKHICFEPGYVPNNIKTYKDVELASDIVESADNLMNEINSDENMNYYIVSGYRSEDYQVQIYNSYVAIDGVNKADTYSARPGCSEHQTGYTFDIISSNGSGILDDLNDNKSDSNKIKELALKYGFIIRYEEDKVGITQYQYEAWHLRYVGVETANIINNYNIAFETYINNKNYYDKLYEIQVNNK